MSIDYDKLAKAMREAFKDDMVSCCERCGKKSSTVGGRRLATVYDADLCNKCTNVFEAFIGLQPDFKKRKQLEVKFQAYKTAYEGSRHGDFLHCLMAPLHEEVSEVNSKLFQITKEWMEKNE
jgi:hypothetical protein